MDRLRRLTEVRQLKLAVESTAGLVDGDQGIEYTAVLAEARIDNRRKLLVVVVVPAPA